MGMYDSFYDEDSECPKCRTKIRDDWQTKHLHRLLEHWKKGDFVEYQKHEAIPKKERERKYGNRPFTPLLRTTKEYLSDAPLLFNGKVPVHTSCKKCEAWLVAYAKVLDGKFVGIVEIEADHKEKELVLIKPETTANTLREEFHRKLSHLQESCNHEKTQWTDFEWAPGHFAGRVRVCLRCEEILESKKGWETAQAPRKPKKSRDQIGIRKGSRKSRQLQNHPDRLKKLLKTSVKLR